MVKLNKKWKMYVIHHSHTDIGYTERQERIGYNHVEYIKEVIDVLNEAYVNGKTEWQGFKWTCESFWCVERFLEEADENYKKDFLKYVKLGNIGISANYLNLTEIVNEDVLNDTLKEVRKKCNELGIEGNHAMTADINGYSWGYADALYNNGVKYLYSCIHTHHGLFPLRKKQKPFYWESPNGNKVLAWNGEHYHIGNELGFVQGWPYMIKDEMNNMTNLDPWVKFENRIYRYLQQLEMEDYPFPFVSVTISGLMTDNSPCNTKIIEMINKFNEVHGEEVEIQMATLEDVFNELDKHKDEIETFKGDWTDWWADGVGSTPDVVKHYREAQRRYNICKMIDPENKLGSKELMHSAMRDLMFYSEHTWGYSSSITEPWDTMVSTLDLRKTLYASRAHENVSKNLDKITFAKGETTLKVNKDIKFKVINPYDVEITDVARYNAEIIFGHKYASIVDEATGEVLPYQFSRFSRGVTVNVLVTLKPHEEKTLVFKDYEPEFKGSVSNIARGGSDGVEDLTLAFKEKEMYANPYKMETPFFTITLEEGEGVVSILDKKNNRELLRTDRSFNPFAPVYEVTPFKYGPGDDRRRMGRNRKTVATQRYEGQLTNVEMLDDGELFCTAVLYYEVEGSSNYSVLLTIYKHIPRIDFAIRFNKHSVWEPENLYTPLPFTTGTKETLWIEKTGALLRPTIDQLPGTCIDFYSIQDGMFYIGEDSALIVGMKDTPLIHLGDIRAKEVKICGDDGAHGNHAEVYSWVMNNFWETNFKASLGGFHEYRYSIYLANGVTDKEKALNLAKTINGGLVAFNRYE